MSTSTLNLYLRHLALSTEVRRLGTTSDHNLLASYESQHSQAAFTELMRRYGPMVLRTCRRVLGRGPDAEDAFQATFLLMSRKAGPLRREVRSLGGWLHRVAYQTARDVLRGAVRRREHEKQASVMKYADRDSSAEAAWNEIEPILDAELDALPDEARRLLIACCLQEKTHTEVAAELGMPRSSLERHLEKARALLAKRLARRGIVVSVPLLTVLLEESAKGAGVPAVLLVHTVEAARRFTLHMTGALSENVARLVKGGLANMTKGWTHWSMALVGWVGLLGAGLIACQTLKAWPDRPSESEPSATAERPAQEGNKHARTDLYGDPLPPGALARMGTTRLRHGDHVEHVLFAPDGKTVASGGNDGTVRLWDVATGKLVRSLKQPVNWSVWSRPLSFARDGKTLTSVAHNQLWQWDVTTGELLHELKLKARKSNQQVFSLVVSSDGKMAASWEDGTTIRLWDVASGNPLRVLQEHGKSIHLLSFSPDNKTLASVAADGDDKVKVVRLWDVHSGKLLQKLEHPLGVWTVVFAPDGKTLASGGGDTQQLHNPSAVRLWDVATGKLLRTLEGHQQFITSSSFSPNGKVLASGSEDRTIRLWDVATGKELRKLKGLGFFSHSLSFAPDGKVLASGGNGSPAVRLWDVTTGEELHRPEGAHKASVHSVSFSPGGRTLATAAAWGDDAVRLWDAASGKPLRRLEPPMGAHSAVFSPDGKTLASGEGVVCIWDATTGKPRRKLEASGGYPLAFSPDGKLLVVVADNGAGAAWSGTLRLWDVATGTQLHALEHPANIPPTRIMSVAFSPDSKTLAVGTWRSTLHLWDAVTGKELRKFKEDWGEIAALSFSPDGKTLAAGSYDHKIHLLEVATGKEIHTLKGHWQHVQAVAFSPSGRLLASGDDQTVQLWEVNAGLASPCHQFRGHAARVTSVAFSPDGRRLASGSEDSTALVWDVTGRAGGQARVARLTHGELTACWQSLTSTDAARAYQAMRTLAAAPDQAVPFLAERLLPKRPDPRQVARLLADLDSEEFRVRSRAAKELEKLGEAVELALSQALQDKPSVEVRRRILQLLDALDPPHGGVSPRLLRWLRAVEVLEWIDTPAARELLEKLAAAPPREEVGREAKVALKRLHALPSP